MPEDLESRLENNATGRTKSDQVPPKKPDGLDAPLPCDVTINGGMTFSKGVKLRTFVNAAERWRKLAIETMTRSSAQPSRDDIIQVLLATREQSEGVTADALLTLMNQTPSREELKERISEEIGFPQDFKDTLSQFFSSGKS